MGYFLWKFFEIVVIDDMVVGIVLVEDQEDEIVLSFLL